MWWTCWSASTSRVCQPRPPTGHPRRRRPTWARRRPLWARGSSNSHRRVRSSCSRLLRLSRRRLRSSSFRCGRATRQLLRARKTLRLRAWRTPLGTVASALLVRRALLGAVSVQPERTWAPPGRESPPLTTPTRFLGVHRRHRQCRHRASMIASSTAKGPRCVRLRGQTLTPDCVTDGTEASTLGGHAVRGQTLTSCGSYPNTSVGSNTHGRGCAQARVCASAKHRADSPDSEFAPCAEHRSTGCIDGFVPLIVLVTGSHEMPGSLASMVRF